MFFGSIKQYREWPASAKTFAGRFFISHWNLGGGIVANTTCEETVLHHEEGMDLLPANKLLTGMELWLQTIEDNKTVLKDVLSHFNDDYEYIRLHAFARNAHSERIYGR